MVMGWRRLAIFNEGLSYSQACPRGVISVRLGQLELILIGFMRMTISQLLCCILNKVCTINGIEEGDCTPFTDNSTNIVHEICDKLEKSGFERHGYEEMYNGMTGRKIKSKIFIGPTYYQKLKHMVADKVYARNNGNIQLLTEQPVGGRSKCGQWALKWFYLFKRCAHIVKWKKVAMSFGKKFHMILIMRYLQLV
jgi:hypothetical protein